MHGLVLALVLGNAWHLPHNAEPGIATMRAPVAHAAAEAPIAIYAGNQYTGSGNPGNVLTLSSALLYREVHAAAFTEVPIAYVSTAGNNKYFVATIPASALHPGDVVEYYLRLAYSDHATTFVYGDDAESQTTADEPTAQQNAFGLFVDWPLVPSGTAHTFRPAGSAFELRVYDGSGHIGLAPDGAAEIDLAPFSALESNRWVTAGAIVAARPLADGIEVDQTFGKGQITARATFVADGVLRYEVTSFGGAPPASATQISAAAAPDEHFYGLGEKFDSVDQAGLVVRISSTDVAGTKGDHSYKVAPWFMSSHGYGFYCEETTDGSYDMRSTLGDRWVATTFAPGVKVDLVGGPGLKDALARYTALSGRAPLPPPWAFGPWMSSDIWRDGGEVRYVVEKLAAEGIPGSVFVFDSPWETAYNDFTWNETQFSAGNTYEGVAYDGFSSAREMTEFLRAHGYRVVLWLTPFVNVSSFDEGVAGQNLGQASTYDDAAAQGFFVRASPGGAPALIDWWKGTGSAIDFTNPAAVAWFQGQLKALVDDSDGVVSGFKTDDGEGNLVAPSLAYADGRTGVDMIGGWAVAYHRAAWNVLGNDGILWARSGFSGTQAYPGAWAGDNEPNFGEDNGLPSVIKAGLSIAMSGWSIWGSDIGGYQDVNPSSTPENLFMRWTQFGAFSPIMQMHRQISAGRQYPWSFGPDGLENYRRYTQLHTSLFPYIYTLAQETSVDGLPIMRPLVLDDPVGSAGIDDEYLFGDAFLVAPMTTNTQTSRSVRLPSGSAWRDYWSGELHQGGQTITFSDADQMHLPLLVRDGSIVPTLIDTPQTLNDADYVGDPSVATPDSGIDFRVEATFSGGSFTMYDGTQVDSALGPERVDLTVTASPARELRFLILTGATPLGVTHDGVELPQLATLTDAPEGWTLEGTAAHVRIAHDGAAQTVVSLLLDEGAGKADGPGPGGISAAGCQISSGGSHAPAGWIGLILGLFGLRVVLRRPR